MKKLLLFSILSWALMACTKDDDTSTLEVTPDTPIVFSAAATEVFTLVVTTNQCEWYAVSDQSWCRVSATGTRLTVTAIPNVLNTSPTPATITVRAGDAAPVTIKVTQYGSGGGGGDDEVRLVVTPSDPIQFSAEATETFVLNVSTNQGPWDAVSDQPWCRVIPGGSKIVINALPNVRNFSPAPATITITSGDAAPIQIAVTQLASQFVYMPDVIFRNVMISGFDTNFDGKLSLDEAAQAVEIQHYGFQGNIFDITGIEACVNLEKLSLQGTEYYSNVDLRNNKKLTTIILQSDRLTNLNINGLVDLSYLSISSTYSSNLVELDVSTNRSLIDFSVPFSVLTLWVSPGQAIDNFYFSNPDTVIKYR